MLVQPESLIHREQSGIAGLLAGPDPNHTSFQCVEQNWKSRIAARIAGFLAGQSYPFLYASANSLAAQTFALIHHMKGEPHTWSSPNSWLTAGLRRSLGKN